MKIQNDTGVTYAANTNRYSNTQNAGSKTGRTYKNAHEYKNYLTQKYDCLRSKDYSVNINSSLLSEAISTRMLVRCDADGKLYLYDLVRTKKETSKPHEQQLYGSKLRFFLTPIVKVYVLFVKKKILKGCDFMAYSQQLWDEAKRKCKLGEEEIRMAKEMRLNPKSHKRKK